MTHYLMLPTVELHFHIKLTLLPECGEDATTTIQLWNSAPFKIPPNSRTLHYVIK